MSAYPECGAIMFELRFASLFDQARALVFPCDAQGAVNVEALPARARSNYKLACARVGRDYATPSVSLTDAAVAA
jgi:hypothetical protein